MISRAGLERTLVLVRTAIAAAATPRSCPAWSMASRSIMQMRHTEARIVNYELAALSPGHLAEIRVIRRAIDAELHALVEAGVASGVFETPCPGGFRSPCCPWGSI